MNEEANFCSQCGTTVSPSAKFCSNCGCDLHNSSTKTPLDKAIQVEVTNVTVEKGFKAVEKGVKAVKTIPKRVWRFLKPLLIVLLIMGFFAWIFICVVNGPFLERGTC